MINLSFGFGNLLKLAVEVESEVISCGGVSSTWETVVPTVAGTHTGCIGVWLAENKGTTEWLLNLLSLRFLPGINPDSNKALINIFCSPYQDSKVSDKDLSQADTRKMNRLPEFNLNQTVQEVFIVLTIWFNMPVWESQRMDWFSFFLILERTW